MLWEVDTLLSILESVAQTPEPKWITILDDEGSSLLVASCDRIVHH